ncbi:N-acetylmuramoyl-L-alanine amidase [Hahella sp. KA22]|uniref:peptidoglycan recognition protein family protein n=1 Tax=Hahella sp. KA22 TaxID=1628392 RepID=UPI000FDD0AFC|nr:peptidoglycan recognition family protein [Hahella sp. KA22]AZZ91945.1 N-acetylmuramoyl-L-alanine amidase [Hahella sp. KA22]QAY55316.1 N-acetylmuramoyl-L-alanine amidase [Hahella sp. KA22]
MNEKYYTVKKRPEEWGDDRGVCHGVVTTEPWVRNNFFIGEILVKGRKSWGALEPRWYNEVIYYNTSWQPLTCFLNRIVIHHTNNSNSIMENEKKQQSKGYAALGYHFFIDTEGNVLEGRPIEVMGSHAGRGKVSGPVNDPDWGAIGIVLQGDYHHEDDWIYSTHAPQIQLGKLFKLIVVLKNKYQINKLLMHREVKRDGKVTVCPGDHLAKIIIDYRSQIAMEGQ